MSWLEELKREAKTLMKGLEDSLSEGLIVDPYMGCPVKVSSPPSWLPIPLCSGGFLEPVPLPREHLPQAVAILRVELGKHPVQVLRESIALVCLYDSLVRENAPVQGWSECEDRVLYAAGGCSEDGWEDKLRASLQLHVSHLILKANRTHFAVEAWAAVCPSGFVYQMKDGLHHREGSTWNPGLFGRGFLSEAGASSLEADFCSVCQELFFGTNRFWSLLEQHPRLRSKARLAMTFFRHLHEDYSEARFRTFAEPQRD